jgi:hypothetical protein
LREVIVADIGRWEDSVVRLGRELDDGGPVHGEDVDLLAVELRGQRLLRSWDHEALLAHGVEQPGTRVNDVLIS